MPTAQLYVKMCICVTMIFAPPEVMYCAAPVLAEFELILDFGLRLKKQKD